MHILITGGTGFIGRALANHFDQNGHHVTVLTRQVAKPSYLPANVTLVQALQPAEYYEVIINLAGAPLNEKRWSTTVKENILKSRLRTTQMVIDYIKQAKQKPRALLSGSAIGYYGESAERCFSESSLPATYDFPHQLCNKWEQLALQAEQFGVRVCLLRTGIVLGPHGGVLQKMWWPFKLGAGAQIGNGKQWMSWIHLQDMVHAIDFLLQSDLKGPINLTAPQAVNNAEFSNALAAQFNRRCWFKMPAIAVKILFGEMGEKLLLQGQHVVPQQLQSAGYQFKFTEIHHALAEIAAHW